MLKLDRLISGSLPGPPTHWMRVPLASRAMLGKDLSSLRYRRAQLSHIRFPRPCAALRRGSGTHHPVICQIDANARRSARKSPHCRKHANIWMVCAIEILFSHLLAQRSWFSAAAPSHSPIAACLRFLPDSAGVSLGCQLSLFRPAPAGSEVPGSTLKRHGAKVVHSARRPASLQDDSRAATASVVRVLTDETSRGRRQGSLSPQSTSSPIPLKRAQKVFSYALEPQHARPGHAWKYSSVDTGNSRPCSELQGGTPPQIGEIGCGDHREARNPALSRR